MLNSLLKLAAANNPLCSGKGTSKPVFAADVFRDLQGSRVHLNSEQLDQYLKILCDEKVVCGYHGTCVAMTTITTALFCPILS